MSRLIWIYAVCESLLLSPVAAKVKETQCCSILPVTLKIYLTLIYPCPISLCKHEQNLRRYLDVYVEIFCLVNTVRAQWRYDARTTVHDGPNRRY